MRYICIAWPGGSGSFNHVRDLWEREGGGRGERGNRKRGGKRRERELTEGREGDQPAI